MRRRALANDHNAACEGKLMKYSERLHFRRIAPGLSLWLALSLGGIAGTSRAEQAPQRRQLGELVSLIALIANPEKFNGKHVRVRGYATVGLENNFLYLNPYNAQVFGVENAIALDLSVAQFTQRRHLDHQPVEVEGTFFFPIGGLGACPNGGITKITTFELDYGPQVVPRENVR
jgi:hypothetical protein